MQDNISFQINLVIYKTFSYVLSDIRVVLINVVVIDKGIIDKRIISLILFFVFEGLYPSGVRIKKEGFIPLC